MKRWQFWVGILISAVLLYFALQKQNLGLVWETLKNRALPVADPGDRGLFCGRLGARLALALPAATRSKTIPTTAMFPIVTIGYMGNNIYPARAGEVLRAVVLKRREGVPVSASLATIIVERVFDGVVMLGFVFLNLPEAGDV